MLRTRSDCEAVRKAEPELSLGMLVRSILKRLRLPDGK